MTNDNEDNSKFITMTEYSWLPKEYVYILEKENKILRNIISKCATSLGNGGIVSPDCSVEFLEFVPKEIEMCVFNLRNEIKQLKERVPPL